MWGVSDPNHPLLGSSQYADVSFVLRSPEEDKILQVWASWELNKKRRITQPPTSSLLSGKDIVLALVELCAHQDHHIPFCHLLSSWMGPNIYCCMALFSCARLCISSCWTLWNSFWNILIPSGYSHFSFHDFSFFSVVTSHTQGQKIKARKQ